MRFVPLLTQERALGGSGRRPRGAPPDRPGVGRARRHGPGEARSRTGSVLVLTFSTHDGAVLPRRPRLRCATRADPLAPLRHAVVFLANQLVQIGEAASQVRLFPLLLVSNVQRADADDSSPRSQYASTVPALAVLVQRFPYQGYLTSLHQLFLRVRHVSLFRSRAHLDEVCAAARAKHLADSSCARAATGRHAQRHVPRREGHPHARHHRYRQAGASAHSRARPRARRSGSLGATSLGSAGSSRSSLTDIVHRTARSCSRSGTTTTSSTTTSAGPSSRSSASTPAPPSSSRLCVARPSAFPWLGHAALDAACDRV